MKWTIIIGPILLLFVWIGTTYSGLIKPIFLPPPHIVIIEIANQIISGTALDDLGLTVLRWFLGLLVGILLGIPIGLLMGYSEKIYSSLELVIEFFRSIPAMTLFPLFLVFFGVGDLSKMAVAAWAAMLYITVNTIYGVRYSKESRLLMAQTLRAKPWQTFTKIVFPGALPDIFSGFRVSVSLSLIVVVASEMIMGTQMGLGKLIFDYALVYQMDKMYSVIIIAGSLGYFSNKATGMLEKHVIHWGGK